MTFARQKMSVWLGAASFLVLLACGQTALELQPTGEELRALVAQLRIPAGWDLVSEEIVDSPCLDPVAACPMVRRVYEVEADSGFEDDAIRMFTAAGLETSSLERTCEAPDDGCRVTGRRGTITVTARVDEIEEDTLVVVLRAT